MQRILILEDSPESQILMRRILAPEFVLTLTGSIAGARSELSRGEYDLAILDIELPDGDGLRFCAEIKSNERWRHLPVMILTGKSSIEEKTLGFQLGIEDFIAKPFDPLELRLRVSSRLRKIAEQRTSSDVLTLGNLRLDLGSQRAMVVDDSGTRTLDLSPKEFGILTYLAKNPDQIKSREQILSVVWKGAVHLADRTIDSHISRLRKKLKGANVRLEAVVASGYRLSA